MVEEYQTSVIQELLANPVISSFKIIRQENGEDEGYLRVKCLLSNGDLLEFSEYVEVNNNKISIITYSYHWQKTNGELVRRWDNIAHYKDLDNFPYHLHLSDGKVISSVKMTIFNVLTETGKIILT